MGWSSPIWFANGSNKKYRSHRLILSSPLSGLAAATTARSAPSSHPCRLYRLDDSGKVVAIVSSSLPLSALQPRQGRCSTTRLSSSQAPTTQRTPPIECSPSLRPYPTVLRSARYDIILYFSHLSICSLLGLCQNFSRLASLAPKRPRHSDLAC